MKLKLAYILLSAAAVVFCAGVPAYSVPFSRTHGAAVKTQNGDNSTLVSVIFGQPKEAEAQKASRVVAAMPFKAPKSAVSIVPFRSEAMNKDVLATVILPNAYYRQPNRRFPVLYLLHGQDGSHTAWPSIRPDIQRLASMYSMIIVCPDAKNSWYWDSPVDPSLRYETFISKELVGQVDAKYRTIADRKARAIAGLSMGGHGALWNAFRHQDIFGACGSTSGGVEIRQFPKNKNMIASLGEYEKNKGVWDSHTIMNQVELLKPNNLAIIIDCGTEDFLYKANESLHKKLLEHKIPHDYTTRPGKHNWPYWRNSLAYQLLFFDSFFRDPEFLWTRLGAPKKQK